MTSSALGKLKLKTQDESRYGKIVHAGYVDKKSKGSSWTRRWAVLWEDTALRIYETKDRGNVQGKIKMKYVDKVHAVSDAQSMAMNKDKPYFFSIVSNSQQSKTWQFGCDDMHQLNDWVAILNSAITIKKQKMEQEKQEKDKEKNKKNKNNYKPEPEFNDDNYHQNRSSNKYIGHHGRNMSNMDDFSRSSRMSSVQTLSALSIMNSNNDKWTGNSIINSAINEDEMMDDDEDDLLDIEFKIKQMEESISNKLQIEDSKILFEGYLERKTNQKVLGKHLWESRYFKLSTHSLLIYQTDKSNLTESVIKLSSIISVNRNTKNNGNDLRENRFDINIKSQNSAHIESMQLRTEKEMDCKQWINFLSSGKRKHRQSIRNNLRSIQELTNRTKPKKQKTVKKFKRQKTSRKLQDDPNDDDMIGIKEEEDDQFDTNTDINIDKKHDENTHSRNLSMRSWANSISQKQEDFTKEYDDPDLNLSDIQDDNDNDDIIHFEGFLIRKIGKTTDQIGEKIFVRLRDDTLEFSQIEQITISEEELNKFHEENLLGTISVEHIKSVKMSSNENDNEFVIVFDEMDANTDWTLTVPDNKTNGTAEKWVNILQSAHNDAENVQNTILGRNNNNKQNNNNYNNKKKKKEGGSIKALAKMINDETIMELQMSHESQQQLDSFNITENNLIRNQNNDENTKNGFCSCLGF